MNIIIVDDEEHPRRILKNMISWQTLGINQVFVAQNGIEALDIIKKKPIDIVLSDIKMPKMTGLDLAKKVKETFPDTRFLLLSNYGEKDYLKQAIKLNISSFIEKPINIEEITQELEQIIASINEAKQTKNYKDMFSTLDSTIKQKDSQKTLDVIEKIHHRYADDLKKLDYISETLDDYRQKYLQNAVESSSVQQITDYIKNNFNNPELTISLIAKGTGYSPTYLCRIFKQQLGLTINQYILHLRIKKAKHLLRHTNHGLYHIGNLVGYNNGKYFVKLFEKELGIHPNDYRKQDNHD